MDINLKGSAFCIHAVLQHMIKHQTGIIINISSNTGVYRWPTCAAYSVAKSAMIKLTENLAHETHQENITLFYYHSGFVYSIGMTADNLNSPQVVKGYPKDKALKWIKGEYQAGRCPTKWFKFIKISQ